MSLHGRWTLYGTSMEGRAEVAEGLSGKGVMATYMRQQCISQNGGIFIALKNHPFCKNTGMFCGVLFGSTEMLRNHFGVKLLFLSVPFEWHRVTEKDPFLEKKEKGRKNKKKLANCVHVIVPVLATGPRNCSVPLLREKEGERVWSMYCT